MSNTIYELYTNLLKQVLSNEHHYENGLRISYLLRCMDTSQPYSLDHVINVGKHEKQAVRSLCDDPDGQHNYRERIFGFPYTMIGKARLDSLQKMVETTVSEGIEGDFLEAGAWRGGACILMRALLDLLGDSNKKVYVADSFQGLPRPILSEDKGLDFYLDPCLSVDINVVKENFRNFRLLDERVVFMPGWFEDTLRSPEPGKLALLRADGDLYKSTIDILENLYHRVVPGGFVVIDDYGAVAACRQAVEDFRTRRGIFNPIETIDWTGVFWRV